MLSMLCVGKKSKSHIFVLNNFLVRRQSPCLEIRVYSLYIWDHETSKISVMRLAERRIKICLCQNARNNYVMMFEFVTAVFAIIKVFWYGKLSSSSE
jgi:hypothetical protein